MKLTGETKIFLSIIGITLLILVIAVTVLSQPPKPLSRVDLIPSSAPTRGNPEAQTWLVEFSDFQCPACKAFATALDELAATYPDTLFIAYRHFPLPQHPFSEKAARAAQAAHNQGKFWEFGQALFTHQSTLSDAKIIDLGQTVELDMDLFTSDIASATTSAIVKTDLAYANQINLNATPTFFLNGIKLELTSPNDLKIKVEEALK